MRFCLAVLCVVLTVVCHVAIGRPFSFDDLVDQHRQATVLKRADGPNQQELVMARLQELLGPEAFTEIDSHGRLSNLQRLG